MFIVSLMFYMFGFERPPPPRTSATRKSHFTPQTRAFLFQTFLLVVVLSRLVHSTTSDDREDDSVDYDADANEEDEDSADEFAMAMEPIENVTSSYDLFRLRRKLLFFYDRDSRPLYNSIQPIKVYMSVKFVQINHLDEVLQVRPSTRTRSLS